MRLFVLRGNPPSTCRDKLESTRENESVQRIDTGVMICYYISGKYIRLASVMVALPFVIVRHEEG